MDPAYWAMLLLLLVMVGGFYFGYKKFESLSFESNRQQEQIDILRSSLASTTSLLAQNIKETSSTLSAALEKEKANLEKRFGSVQNQVGAISGTVNTLEKLSKTDPELLQKYSKVFFLNEHYAPERVVEVPSKYKYFEARNYAVHASVWPYLQKMLDSALNAGIELYVFSAYRSFDEQGALKGQYTIIYGEGTANQFSADQGYSEHQLGTTVDLITTGIGGTLSGFENTSAYRWLKDNAHKYGFTLSYPENNSFYVFEPWHWRFVGTQLATHLYNTGQNFYGLEQRKIDEYLVNIFD